MSEKDIELLDHVDLRLALAETDQQLEKIVNIFLSPVLLKLESYDEAVREKVMSILTHLNKRVRPKQNIKLPLESLMALFCTDDVTRSPFVKNLALVYIDMAFQRLTEEEMINNLPQLIAGIAVRTPQQKQTLIHIMLLVLPKLKRQHLESTDLFGFKERPADAKFLLDTFLDIILYNPPSRSRKQLDQAGDVPENTTAPPGLSLRAVKFVTNDGKAVWVSEFATIKPIKLGILRFATSQDIIPDSLGENILLAKFVLFLSASCDLAHEIVDAGENGLKKINKPDLESNMVVDRLYSLYQGSSRPRNPTTLVQAQSETLREAASPSFKYKIVGYLCKSRLATVALPGMLAVSFDCLYGPATNAKLQNQGMAFVQWVARMAETSRLKVVAPVLLSGLLKCIKELTNNDKENLRAFAYVSVSLLAKRVPEIVRKDISILASFFAAMSTESSNVKASISEALSTMVDAFKDLDKWASEKDIQTIETIIEENINKMEHQSRYCAVKYAVVLFPFSHILSRYICLLMSTDDKLEVREMAASGLAFPDLHSPKLYPNDTNEELQLPSFNELVTFIDAKAAERREQHLNILQTTSTGRRYVMTYDSEVYMNMLRFLRCVLIATADPTATLGQLGNEFNGITDSRVRTLVKEWIRKQWTKQQTDDNSMDTDETQQQNGLKLYLQLIEKGLDSEGMIDTLLQTTASACLLELISLGPSSLSRTYENKITWLTTFLRVIKLEVRDNMAHILGIVSTSELDCNESRCTSLKQLISELITTAKDFSREVSTERHQGSILALGYIIGRIIYRYPHNYKTLIPSSLLSDAINLIVKDLQSQKTSIISVACLSLSEAGRYGPLPIAETQMITEDVKDVKGKGTSKETDDDEFDNILESLIKIVKTNKDVKLRETATIALGHITLGDNSRSDKVLSLFYDLAFSITKEVEIHFTIGEAIASTVAGWQSQAMEIYLDVADANIPEVTIDNDVIENFFSKIFDELLPSGKAAVRKAICIWILCLVKFCSKHDTVKTKLPRIHSIFSALLADRDEFTQEVASKGIGLVYELGDQAMRDQLVVSLVGMLSSGNKPKETIDRDTQLFDNNTLGQAPDGSVITTYQSILSLASDMNQPELVYKFMQLASHNAVWQTRKGAAFGFSTIIAQAERELQPYLKDLVPRLYRYQFDPNPKVNEAMSSIWKALVKEPKKAVDEYFDVIIKDLLRGLGNRLWRTRESSANALSDLLQGRQIQQLEPYLQDLWTMCFRALDDIKESVRKAAFKTCRALTNATVKYCDPTQVSVADGEKVMKIVMPFFLHKGLVSEAEDVRKHSLNTILKICKNAGVLLKDHITDIVGTLLDALSDMEPQLMNYLSFHVDKYEVSTEQLDNSRLSATKMSPMMKGIEICVDYIDETVMASLVPRLLQLVRKGVGLPTKAGCARILVTLCIKKPQELRPHADSLMKVLSGAIVDKSPVVRKSYAVAAGYVAHLSSDSTLIKFIDHLRKLYCDSDNEPRSISGITMLEMSRHASDELKRICVEVLPLAYFGTSDENKDISEIWTEVWEENTAGSTAALKLYIKEMVEFLIPLLGSSSWVFKKQAGMTIANIAKTLENGMLPYMDQLLPLLTNGLSGRTWPGKEALVEALTVLSISCSSYFENERGTQELDAIGKILIRESKKNDRQYKRKAIENLGKFGSTFNEKIDVYSEAKDFLIAIAKSEQNPDEMEIDNANDRPLFFLVKASAIKTLGLVWSKQKLIQVNHSKELAAVFAESLQPEKNIWNVRLCILEAVEQFLDKLNFANTTDDVLLTWNDIMDEEVTMKMLGGLREGIKDTRYVAIRNASFNTLKKFIEKAQETIVLISNPDVKANILETLSLASQDALPTIADPARELRNSLSR